MMNETIAHAHERLAAAFRERNYILRDLSGVIDSIGVDDQSRRYLFSWHKHSEHLLFYIRDEALRAKSTLHQKAMFHHSGHARRNPKGETTITLNSDDDARTLLRWLLPHLPLPRSL